MFRDHEHMLTSIKSKVMMVGIALAIAATGLLTLALYHQTRGDLERLLSEEQFAGAARLASAFDSELITRRKILQSVAASVTPQMVHDPRRLTAMLAGYPALRALFPQGLSVVGADGATLADLPERAGRKGTNVAGRAWFADVKATRQPVIGEPYLGGATQRPLFVIAAPIGDGPDFRGAVAATLYLDQDNFFIDTFRADHVGNAGVRSLAVISEKSGVFLASQDEARIMTRVSPGGVNKMVDRYMAGFEGSGISTNSKGSEELFSSKRLTAAPWRVIVALPTAIAYQPIERFKGQALVWMLLFATLAALVFWLVVARFLRPVLEASSIITQRLAGFPAGGYLPLPAGGDDEIGTLLRSFNELQASLLKSEERYRLLITNARVPVLVVAMADGAVLFINDQASAFFGVPSDRAAGLRARDYWVQAEERLRYVDALVQGGRVAGFEAELRAANGENRWVLLSSSVIDYDGVPAVFTVFHDIAERRRAEEKATRLQQQQNAILQSEIVGISLLRNREMVWTNPTFSRMLGYEPGELDGKPARSVYPDEASYRMVGETGYPIIERGETFRTEIQFMHKSGRRCWLDISGCRLAEGSDASVWAFVAIDERKAAEMGLKLSASVFDSAAEGMLITDPRGRILDVNRAFTQLTGYARDDVLGGMPNLLKSDRQENGFYAAMWKELLAGGRWQGELWNRRKSGEEFVASMTISAVADENGITNHYVGVFADVTELKRQQEYVQRLAYYDALTQLPNRMLLSDRMQQTLARAERQQSLLAVCYLDLDGFKPINDQHGHKAGDQVLVEVARRLADCVRAQDTAARLGGDEFVLLLADLQSECECETILARVMKSLAQPFSLGFGSSVSLSCSIGVCFYPGAGADPDTLIRHGDQAMYAAKQAGRNQVQIFDAQRDLKIREHQVMSQRLREGLARNEFVLHWQPKVDLRLGKVVGAEALIRWQRDGNLVMPGEFLPPIEDDELIVEVGNWVMDAAIRQLAQWQDQGVAINASINVAARQLRDGKLRTRILELLQQHPSVKVNQIELEILETAALDDVAASSRVIAECKASGLSFALDDFGTGYSSMTYFRHLPVDTVKIDQSFVRDMLKDRNALAIVKGILGITGAFDKKVIAEGVEDIEHGVMLLRLGCHLAQGYAIARPMPATELLVWIAAWQPHPAFRDMAAMNWAIEDYPLVTAELEGERLLKELADYVADLERGCAPIRAAEVGASQFVRWLRERKDRSGRLPSFTAADEAYARFGNSMRHSLQSALGGDIAWAKEQLAIAAQLLAEFAQVATALRVEVAVAEVSSGEWQSSAA